MAISHGSAAADEDRLDQLFRGVLVDDSEGLAPSRWLWRRTRQAASARRFAASGMPSTGLPKDTSAPVDSRLGILPRSMVDLER